MNKELTPLEAFKRIVICNDLENPVRGQTDEIDIVKNALERESKIDSVLPDFINDIEDLKMLCNREVKELKALDIIKETLGIDLYFSDLEQKYYIAIGGLVAYPLKGKEIYDLLKEVLLWK